MLKTETFNEKYDDLEFKTSVPLWTMWIFVWFWNFHWEGFNVWNVHIVQIIHFIRFLKSVSILPEIAEYIES